MLCETLRTRRSSARARREKERAVLGRLQHAADDVASAGAALDASLEAGREDELLLMNALQGLDGRAQEVLGAGGGGDGIAGQAENERVRLLEVAEREGFPGRSATW